MISGMVILGAVPKETKVRYTTAPVVDAAVIGGEKRKHRYRCVPVKAWFSGRGVKLVIFGRSARISAWYCL